MLLKPRLFVVCPVNLTLNLQEKRLKLHWLFGPFFCPWSNETISIHLSLGEAPFLIRWKAFILHGEVTLFVGQLSCPVNKSIVYMFLYIYIYDYLRLSFCIVFHNRSFCLVLVIRKGSLKSALNKSSSSVAPRPNGTRGIWSCWQHHRNPGELDVSTIGHRDFMGVNGEIPYQYNIYRYI